MSQNSDEQNYFKKHEQILLHAFYFNMLILILIIPFPSSSARSQASGGNSNLGAPMSAGTPFSQRSVVDLILPNYRSCK